MTDSQIFEKLFNGGNFALPYLIKFSHPTLESVLLVNNNENIVFNGEEFKASTFDYSPPSPDGTGATLNISSLPGENDLFEFIENSDDKYILEVVGLIVDGEIQQIKTYRHFHGVATMEQNGQISFSLEGDDRLQMTFPPYVYDTDNNRGNA